MELSALLLEGSRKLGIDLQSETIQKMLQYMELVQVWNEKFNLTAITEPQDMITKHFLDSISLFTCPHMPLHGRVIDVGTGAGFPGLLMAIVKSDLEVTLLDSLAKRVGFLDECTKVLSLANIHSVHSRAEDAGSNDPYREKYDVATARAVAPLPVLAEYCLPFVRCGGYFFAMKGPGAKDEVAQSLRALELLGGKLEDIFEVHIPFCELSRNIVVIKKIASTNAKYPRKAGKPERSPL